MWPVHLYNFCSRIVTYTLLVFLGKKNNNNSHSSVVHLDWFLRRFKGQETFVRIRKLKEKKKSGIAVAVGNNMSGRGEMRKIYRSSNRRNEKIYKTQTHERSRENTNTKGKRSRCDTDEITSADHKKKKKKEFFFHSRKEVVKRGFFAFAVFLPALDI